MHGVKGVDVKPATVRRCFQKCGVQLVTETDEGGDEDEEDDVGLAQLLSDTTTHLHLPQPMDADEYLAVDNAAPSTEDLDQDWEKTLIETFVTPDTVESGLSDVEAEEETPEEPPLSLPEIMKKITSIRSAALQRDVPDALPLLYKLETLFQPTNITTKQTTITNFFS